MVIQASHITHLRRFSDNINGNAMDFALLITNFLNGTIARLFSGFLPRISIPGISPSKPSYPPSNNGGISPPTSQGKGHSITIPEHITARFDSVGSPAWGPDGVDNPGGKHFGTDFSARQGTAVYAGFPFTVIQIGTYDDDARYGQYIIGTMGDGYQYYSGHLQNVKVSSGQTVQGGEQIAETNHLNHTHIQLKDPSGNLRDYEKYRGTA